MDMKDRILRLGEKAGLAIYFAVLFAERTVAIVLPFVKEDYDLASLLNFTDFYAMTVTAVSLLTTVMLLAVAAVVHFRSRIVRESVRAGNTDLRLLLYAAGTLLVGGMVHTPFTFLIVQFVAYGSLLISMLLRTVRGGVTTDRKEPFRRTVSYVYLTCLSMAIPVVYPVITTTFAFVPLEIVTSLFGVWIFTVLLERFYASGGFVVFGLPTVLILGACDVAILALRWNETVNWFLLIFSALTVALWLVGRFVIGNRRPIVFEGYRHTRKYFEGWYFKVQQGDTVFAMIPSYHVTADGDRYAMLQIVCGESPVSFRFPTSDFSAREDMLSVGIGNSKFTKHSVSLDEKTGGHSVRGELAFDGLVGLKHDIMGPFADLPLMQCKHNVLAMDGNVRGAITVDGTEYRFDGGRVYIEKDQGRSFPKDYVWSQGLFPSSSVMLAVASIPYGAVKFTGCICHIRAEGKDVRLATYNFVRVTERTERSVSLRRGKYRLSLTAESIAPCTLAAPTDGEMSRAVHESPAASVRCVFSCGDRVLIDTVGAAGFETGKSE